MAIVSATTTNQQVGESKPVGYLIAAPQSSDQRIQLSFERSTFEYIDGHDDVAAFTQVDQRQRKIRIQQGGECNDDGARGNGCARRQCSGRSFESIAGAERGHLDPPADDGFEVSYVPEDGAEDRVPLAQAWAVPLERGVPRSPVHVPDETLDPDRAQRVPALRVGVGPTDDSTH